MREGKGERLFSKTSLDERRGNEYERGAGEWFRRKYGDAWKTGFEMCYRTLEGSGMLRPDGVLLLPSKIVVVELKLRASQWAWLQLRHKYGPLVRKYWGKPTAELVVAQHVPQWINGVPEQPYLTDEPERCGTSGWWAMRLRLGV